MDELLISDDKDRVLKCFKDQNVILYLWQDDGTAPKRVIYPSKVKRLDTENGSVQFETHDYKDYDLFPGKIFCYNEDLKYFFKLEQVEIQSNTLTVELPHKINVLSESQNSKMSTTLYEFFKKSKEVPLRHSSSSNSDHMVYVGPRDHIDLGVEKIKTSVGSKNRSSSDQSLFDEIVGSQALSAEDLEFADKRNAPRAKPKKGKVAHILTDSGVAAFTLYDLSTGGMSLVSSDISAFKEQEEVSIAGFDEKVFDSPLKAIIRNIRDIEDLVGQYKIGLQFLEE